MVGEFGILDSCSSSECCRLNLTVRSLWFSRRPPFGTAERFRHEWNKKTEECQVNLMIVIVLSRTIPLQPTFALHHYYLDRYVVLFAPAYMGTAVSGNIFVQNDVVMDRPAFILYAKTGCLL